MTLLIQRRKRSSARGAFTIEACIVLPIFLCLLMAVLNYGKLTIFSMQLEHAVSEVTKQIAATSYPVSLVNEYGDELLRKNGVDVLAKDKNFTGILLQEVDKSLLEADFLQLMSGDLKEFDLKKLLEKSYDIAGKGLIKAILGSTHEKYWELKSKGGILIASKLLEKGIDNTYLDSSKVMLTFCKLPDSALEYEYKSANGFYQEFCEEQYYLAAEDVAIQACYELKLVMPLFGTKSINISSTAVEKAWLYGSHGTVTSREEGLELLSEEEARLVFITRTGIRYHVGSCRHLHSSKIPVALKKAEEDGYTPCKVCKP